VTGPAARGRVLLADLRTRHDWIDHVARAVVRYHESHGNHLAAAITFYSLLNAVPLLMLAFAGAGYLLFLHPPLVTAVESGLARAVPPELAGAVEPVVTTAVGQRAAVGGFGLLAALWAGTWWMSNLRQALSAQWALPPRNPASVRRLLSDLLALAGMWCAVLGTLAVSAVGTGIGEAALRLLGWSGTGWTRATQVGLGLLLGLAADWLIFYWVLTRLPRTRVHVRGAAHAALLGALGFEVLRHVLTLYLAGVSTSPGGAVFGSLLGLLLFAYLVSRFVLLVAAWVATTGGEDAGPMTDREEVSRPWWTRIQDRTGA
jgi:membrane protein